MDQEHPYELPKMDEPSSNSTSRPETRQSANTRCLTITIIVCTVVLVLAIVAGVVTVASIIGKQQSGASDTNRLDDLENKVTSARTELDSTKVELTSTKTELASTKAELASTKIELATRIQTIETEVNGSIHVNRGVFTAGLSKHLTGLGGGQTVVFDKVHYNPGQDFDPRTGQFTCPLNGIYIFHVTVFTTTSNDYVGVEIVKDAVVVGGTYEDGAFHSASVTVFTQCNKQEQVWVRIRPEHSGKTIHERWSYFSGAFLRPSN